MSGVQDRFTEQARWNELGRERMRTLRDQVGTVLVTRSPHEHRMANDDLMEALEPIAGKKVLELGCASGEFSVFLAKLGAEVVGVDIGPDLVATARAVAAANHMDCTFHTTSITDLPFEDGRFDILVGVAVLHHLLTEDLVAAVDECHRVLKPTGRAIFVEPVENSKVFDLVQKLFPAGRPGTQRYRPSILRRRAWSRYQETVDDRPLTNHEITLAGMQFQRVTLRSYGLLVRLHRLLGARTRPHLVLVDRFLLEHLPPLRHFCKTVLVQYEK